ncbi:hypothetical protein P4O66_008123, partial [Electrophorus voltai]
MGKPNLIQCISLPIPTVPCTMSITVTTNMPKVEVHENMKLAQAPSCQVPETALSGSAVELRCQDELSAPLAVYSWFKDNKLLSSAQLPGAGYSLDPKTGTLKFKSVSATDAGQYRCEASSGTGAPKSCAAQHLKIIE